MLFRLSLNCKYTKTINKPTIIRVINAKILALDQAGYLKNNVIKKVAKFAMKSILIWKIKQTINLRH
jgi:hypothetical protein